MWLPDPIYKALPVVYAAIGALLIPLFGLSTLIVVSAVIFLAAAGLTVYWRMQYRDRPPPIEDILRAKWAQRRARRIATHQAMDLK
jgi:hypothetical protein